MARKRRTQSKRHALRIGARAAAETRPGRQDFDARLRERQDNAAR
jgi:hypothetical protein